MSIPDGFLEDFQDEKLLKLKKKEITPVINRVKCFFVKNKIVIYGGTAMNMYLPKHFQFYDKYDIPDYDGFHSNARNKSIELINMLKKEHFDFLIAKHAIHDGTYKVSWVFKDIADITNVNQYDYDHIIRTSFKHKQSGLLLVNINLLKSSAYIELGMPKSSSFRWSKVYKRLMLLEEKHSITSDININSLFNDTVPIKIEEVINTIYTYVNVNKLPLVGFDAVKYFSKITNDKNNVKFYNTPYTLIEILSDNIYDTMKQVKKILSKSKVYDSEKGIYVNLEYDEIFNDRSQLIPVNVEYVIFVDNTKYKLLKIYDVSNKCISVSTDSTKKNGFVYGSIFFLIYIYYYILFISPNNQESNVYKCIIKNLISEISKANFTTECYGFNKSISVIKKSRALKNFKGVVAKS